MIPYSQNMTHAQLYLRYVGYREAVFLAVFAYVVCVIM